MARRSRARWKRAHIEGRKWNEEDARAAVTAWQKSGKTSAEFAEQHGVKAQRLDWWHRRFQREDEEREAAVPVARLAPVTVRRRVSSDSECVVAVTLPKGVRLEIHDPSAVSLAWLVEAVEMLSQGQGGGGS